MNDALTTLKAASGNKSGYLYDLPWYVIIGPPGAGKTTALVNSGLKFPLSRGTTPAAVAGVGGTRYCDWWFTEEAVLIDTAGRYTYADSDAGMRNGLFREPPNRSNACRRRPRPRAGVVPRDSGNFRPELTSAVVLPAPGGPMMTYHGKSYR